MDLIGGIGLPGRSEQEALAVGAGGEVAPPGDTQPGGKQLRRGAGFERGPITPYRRSHELAAVKETPEGRVLRIADLVDDDPTRRDRVSAALKDPAQKHNRDYVDIIVALGMAERRLRLDLVRSRADGRLSVELD